MRYRLVLWDFDGTLADTLQLSLQIYNELAREHGYRQVEDAGPLRDLPLPELLSRLGVPMRRAPKLIRQLVTRQRQFVGDVRLYPGIAEAVRTIHAAGCGQGVLSTNAEANVRTCLGAQGVEDRFDFVEGYARLQGKRAAIRRLLRRRRVAPAEAVYVGDEVRDVQAARAAGADSAAVCWGINSGELLRAERPTHLLADASELAAAVARWLE